MSAAFGVPVVESTTCPRGQVLYIAGVVYVAGAVRRRWWWKPWTWRRRNLPSELDAIRAGLRGNEQP